jgi:acid phosphatase type 7
MKTIIRLIFSLVLVVLLVETSLAVHAKSQFMPEATILKSFSPVADAYVIQSAATANFGGNAALRVDNSPITHSYLRFVVSGLNGAGVQSAVLRVYANSGNASGFSVQNVSDNAWSENLINFSNAPVPGRVLNSSKSFGAGTFVDVDLSEAIKGEGIFSLLLSTTSVTNTSLAAREAGKSTPQLLIIATSPTITIPTPTGVPQKTPAPQPTASPTGDILLLAGDICKHDLGAPDYTENCKKTGDLIRSVLAANPGAQVQTLGDNVNNDTGASAYDSQYLDLYAPNWGSFLNVTHAVEGNHDTYPPSGSGPYFDYFGAAAGPRPGGYYSYNIGSSWHVVVLNAECTQAGGCKTASPQYTWLQNDLAGNTKACILAVWHQPRWTSGRHPDDATYDAWWNLLYQYKADIIANGHNHNYERFNPINPQEQAAADGIREFVVGTGGAPSDNFSYSTNPLDPNEVVRTQSASYGVLKLTLSASFYTWNFLPAAGYTFTDSGSGTCH